MLQSLRKLVLVDCPSLMYYTPLLSPHSKGISSLSGSGAGRLFEKEDRDPWTGQIREMSRIKPRRTHPRYMWPKKKRERHDQELTKDNQEFISQLILEKHGPTYQEGSQGMPWVSPLKGVEHARGEWTPESVRTGVIGKKIGVHPLWDKNGNRFLATLVQVVDNHVIKYIPPEVVQKNYGPSVGRAGERGILLVGAQSADPQLFTKEYCGLFQEAGILPKVKIHRFTVTPNAYLQPGTPLYASHFQVGQVVDVGGKTVDRGYQGVMKRWGFKGMPATHGVTKSHRRGGNIGGGGEKGRVWPGTKMPGHMGALWRVLRGQEIVRINWKYNVIYLRGPAIMGETGSFVTLRDTCLLHRRLGPPHFPTHYPDEMQQEPTADEEWLPSIFNFADPSITFEEKR